MDAPGPGRPSRDTGLPPGVAAGPLGRRFVAYLIDILVPGVLGGLIGALVPTASATTRSVVIVVGTVLALVWAVLCWFLLATRAASPGLRALKLQLVGFYDGRPVGWGRVLLRTVLYGLLSATGLGLVLMLVFLLLHPRHQGWHDLAARAVVIKERPLAPRPTVPPAVGRPAPAPAQLEAAAPAQPVSPPVQASPAPLAADPYGAPVPLSPPPGTTGPSSTPEGLRAPGAVPPSGLQDAPQGAPTVLPAAPDPTGTGTAGVVWVAALDDGREIILDALVLLGRNPQAEPGEEDAQLIKIADETRTVSKSHLAVNVFEDLVYVADRGSTNGSTVTTATGISTRCPAGEWVLVGAGSIVSIGDHWLEVRHADG